MPPTPKSTVFERKSRPKSPRSFLGGVFLGIVLTIMTIGILDNLGVNVCGVISDDSDDAEWPVKPH